MNAKEMFEELGFNYYKGDEFITIGKEKKTRYTFKYYGITFNLKSKIVFAHINTKVEGYDVDRKHLTFNEIHLPIRIAIEEQRKELYEETNCEWKWIV